MGNVLSTLVFPEVCRLCGRIMPCPGKSYPLCVLCEQDLERISGEGCAVCGRPLISETGSCTLCRKRQGNYVIRYNRPVFEYRDQVRELIGQYKFGNAHGLRGFFALKLRDAYREGFEGLPLVPVPSSEKSVKKRGWDHMDEISRFMETEFSIHVIRLLKKTGRYSQKELDYEDRVALIQGSIQLKDMRRRGPIAAQYAPFPRSEALPPADLPPTVVLLDDVFTTGATVNECARVLMAAGVRNVFSLTLAVD